MLESYVEVTTMFVEHLLLLKVVYSIFNKVKGSFSSMILFQSSFHIPLVLATVLEIYTAGLSGVVSLLPWLLFCYKIINLVPDCICSITENHKRINNHKFR